jgi:eukaryotic-like serine/threonine-protein kinase
MVSAPVAIGDVIADKYSVERVIGEGGMGVVLAARHRELDQRVAIKFLLPEIAQQGMAAERFRREARAAARIRGEHVCRVLDVGTLGNGIPYMVMEYLDGCDLANELERRGRLPPEEAVGYMIEACDAVAEAHAAGIIHRDLKPANLFLATRSDGSRRIKVLDFGVSKSLLDSSSGQHALTVTSSTVGSPLYMSPEQLDSAKDVDRRTDIWALGIVLYELLAGRTPFRGDSIPQLVSAVMHDQPPPFGDLSVTAPDGLEQVVHKALQKPRDQRFGSIAELASALAPFAPRHLGAVSVARASRVTAATAAGVGEWVAQGSTPVPGNSTSFSATTPSQPSSTPLPWTQRTTARGTRVRWGAGLAAVLVLGVTFFVFYRLSASRTGGSADHGAELERPSGPAAASSLRPAIEPAPPQPQVPGDLQPAITGETAPPPGASPAAPPSAPSPSEKPVAVSPASSATSASGKSDGALPGQGAGAAIQPARPRRPRPEDPAKAAPGERAAPAAAQSPAPQPQSSPRGVSDFGGRR